MRLFRFKKKKTLRGYKLSLSLGLWSGKEILLLKHYSKDRAKRKLQVRNKLGQYQELFSDRIVIKEINLLRRKRIQFVQKLKRNSAVEGPPQGGEGEDVGSMVLPLALKS